MANQATFHAKISADARQFVQEVESANDALRGLTASYDKMSKATGSAKGNADTKRSKKVDGEIKALQDAAIAAGNKVTEAELDNIKRIDKERTKTAQRQVGPRRQRPNERVAGPGNFAQETNLLFRQQDQQAKITRQKMLQNAEAREAFANAKSQAATNERELAKDKERLKIQRDLDKSQQRAEGPVRQGSEGIKDLSKMQNTYNNAKKKQAGYEREIANLNRQQMDAMVTGRYALYDMANAYRGIAMGATRVTRALAQTVVQAAKFESSFTAVERAASLDIGTDSFIEMRNALISLSTEIPVAFDEITQIATLGAQMGIATYDLEKFTENIASFAAVTGASIDETAEKFGRISSLAKVPSEEFENLASAVIFAGFNAVATEQEILAMAESISAAASNAGYSGKQIVGLSTALASLGVAPEQSRGVILRLFNDIQRAADGTTDKMAGFASMAGYTSEEFTKIWNESPEQYFSSFLTGLENTENLTGALDALGITNTREINVLQRLSGNMDVYTKSLQEAGQAYDEGTALAEVYSKTSDNLEAKVQQLINAFTALQAASTANLAEGLKPIVDALIEMSEAATTLIKSNVGQALVPLIGGLTAAVAIFAGLRFAGSILTAQLLAMRVAVLKTGQMAQSVTGIFSGLRNAFIGNMYATDALGGKMQFLTKQQINAAASSGLLTKKQKAQILTSGKATIAARSLSIAMTGLGVAMAAAAVIGIGAMIYEMTRFNIDLAESGAGVDALTNAIQQDTKIFEESGEAIATHTNELNTNKNSTLDSREAANLIVDSQGKIAESFIDTTEKIERNTIALGENFKQLMLNSLVDSEEFQKFYDDAAESGLSVIQITQEMGLRFEDLIDAAAKDPGTGALDALIDKVREFSDLNKGDLYQISIGQGGETEAEQVMAKLSIALLEAKGGAGELQGSILAAIDIMSREKGTAAFAGRLFKVLEALDRTTEKSLTVANLKDAFGLLGQGVSEASDETKGLNDNLGGTAKALRTVLDYASDLQGIFGRVVGIEFGESIATDNIADGWAKLADEASDAQDAIADANAEIMELTADRSVLEYQLSVAERYGDEKRAAVLRAKLAKIDGDLADENENLAEAQEEAKKSLVDNTSAGRENRDAILGMVSSYQDLIQAAVETGMEGQELEDYIADLKDEFYAQGESVGYSRDELKLYADLFDEFIDVVERVDPRVDVEFNSNISAAEQAFDEYMAKLQSANGYKTTQTVETVTENKINQPAELRSIINGSDVRLFRMGLEAGRISLFDYYKAVYGMDYKSFNAMQGRPDLSGLTGGTGLYIKRAQGGYVSGPGTGTSDSIPAMLSNGEYVINSAAVRAYGTDFMTALNQQKIGGSFGSSSMAIAGNAGSTIAYLSPEDRALLRAVADRPVNLYADNAKIAQSANQGNVTLAQRGLK